MRKSIGIILVLMAIVPAARLGAAVQPRLRPAPTPAEPRLTLLLRGGYFIPGDGDVKSFYGSRPVLGAGLHYRLGRISGWLEGSKLNGSGRLSYTGEETRMKLAVIEAGALAGFNPIGKARPYVGAGAGYYSFKETNPIGDVKQGKIGFCGIAGATLALGRRMVVDLRLKYSVCTMKPAYFEFGIGGLTAGIGLGIRL